MFHDGIIIHTNKQIENWGNTRLIIVHYYRFINLLKFFVVKDFQVPTNKTDLSNICVCAWWLVICLCISYSAFLHWFFLDQWSVFQLEINCCPLSSINRRRQTGGAKESFDVDFLENLLPKSQCFYYSSSFAINFHLLTLIINLLEATENGHSLWP